MMLDYSLGRTSNPSIEPVSLAELKSSLRIDHSNDDTELLSLIEVGRRAVERDTGRSLITQTWERKRDFWPGFAIELLHPPVQSVTSITYVDTGGTTQTWRSSNYVVDTASQPGLVRLAYSKTWPSIRGDKRGIICTYVAGYGDAATNIPYDLRQAVMLRARSVYDGESDELLSAYERLVDSNMVGVLPG